MMERLLKIKLKKETVMFVLLCIGAVLIFVIFVKFTENVVYAKKAEGIMKKAFDENQQSKQPQVVEKLIASSKTIADSLKTRNAFAIGMVQREFPVRSVNGIFGQEALIDGRWYKQGDQISDATVVAIEATQVRIRWQDIERTFSPIDSQQQQQPTSGRDMQMMRGRGRGGMGGAMQTFVNDGGMDVGQMVQQAENLRQQFMNMSDADRQNMMNQTMEQFGRGGFGGMGGMGGGMGGGRRGGGGGGGGRGGGGGGGGGRGGGGGGGRGG